MRAKAGVFIIICLLLLVATVSGHLPDSSTISTSNPWVTANGVDQTTITVMVSNMSLGSMQGANVIFTIDNPIYGTINPVTTTSDATGKATGTFKANTKSGVAVITARITSHDGYIVTKTLDQNLDHDSPYNSYFTHPLNGTVATDVPFNISITDRWGNRIDDRKEVALSLPLHTISLHVHGPAPDDCSFVGYGHDFSSVLDSNGNMSVKVILTTKVGPNNILMDAFGNIPDRLEWIDADTNGVPFWITQVYSPMGYPPTIPADGTSFFTIKYTLFDKYGNPTNNQYIWVNTSVPGEETKFVSNNLGQVSLQYGPRSSIGVINITATAISNSTYVITSQNVQFMNTGAEIISLTANPDTIASLDANPSRISDILATVADHSGNAVAGELVNFIIQNITYDSTTYNVTAPPVLLSPSNITDSNGVAAVQFRAGSFTTPGYQNYSASATGHCDLIATWNGTQKIVPVTWKNYPYLSVKTSVNPLTVEINNTVDVTIEFRGDGWAMQPRPIDVVLTTDRSGSMMYDNPDRMVNIMEAADTFVDQMGINDQIGLVSFGQKGTAQAITYSGLGPGSDSSTYDDATYRAAHYPTSPKNYADYATVDLNLSLNKAQVKTAINSMVPYSGTPMRSALYKSIQEINLHKGINTVKAIILLSDGDYNYYGDPLARGTGYAESYGHYAYDYGDLTSNYMTFSGLTGTGPFSEQNMSVYAKNNSIRIYSIAFGNQITSGGKMTLRTLAEGTVLADGTHGTYYEASATDIADVYKAIAGELIDNAGVNTTMTSDFENVNVTGVTMPGDQVFDYVYHPSDSTKITWQNGTQTVINQSDDWAADNKLDFNIGTIKVGQFWNATFRLRVNQSGLIDVFSNNSIVSFNGGTETLHLPQTFITVVPKLNVTVIGVKTITLTNLTVTEPGEIKALLPIMWNTNYTGNSTITEKVYYSIDDGPWVLFEIKTHDYNPATMEYVNYAQLDVTKLPPGGYRIRVYATAVDAPDTNAVTDVKLVGGKGKTFIKLE
ncbi:MAG: invasin domain 3-containing protein [Methanoregula sp.]